MPKKVNYEQIISPKELEISDKSKLVFSVSKAEDSNIPHLDIRLHVTSNKYTGLTKKGINFPIEWLPDFLEILDKIDRECAEKGY
ncbi:MAG: hypothetical protein H0Z24_05730 [Thermosipho sp. (in: Bacteria)]|nr:hypothetical protein [Thermosipho sp. (in: thermotogales)]